MQDISSSVRISLSLIEEIAQKQNITAQQNAQLDEIRKTIEQIRSLPEYKT